eukprot:Hpha_TRINITY_DN8588_c0_g3::TRINITY_DN8588_c0_g3_i1::g.146625::m.146625
MPPPPPKRARGALSMIDVWADDSRAHLTTDTPDTTRGGAEHASVSGEDDREKLEQRLRRLQQEAEEGKASARAEAAERSCAADEAATLPLLRAAHQLPTRDPRRLQQLIDAEARLGQGHAAGGRLHVAAAREVASVTKEHSPAAAEEMLQRALCAAQRRGVSGVEVGLLEDLEECCRRQAHMRPGAVAAARGERCGDVRLRHVRAALSQKEGCPACPAAVLLSTGDEVERAKARERVAAMVEEGELQLLRRVFSDPSRSGLHAGVEGRLALGIAIRLGKAQALRTLSTMPGFDPNVPLLCD